MEPDGYGVAGWLVAIVAASIAGHFSGLTEKKRFYALLTAMTAAAYVLGSWVVGGPLLLR